MAFQDFSDFTLRGGSQWIKLWFLFNEHPKCLSLFLILGVTPFRNLFDYLIIFEKNLPVVEICLITSNTAIRYCLWFTFCSFPSPKREIIITSSFTTEAQTASAGVHRGL